MKQLDEGIADTLVSVHVRIQPHCQTARGGDSNRSPIEHGRSSLMKAPSSRSAISIRSSSAALEFPRDLTIAITPENLNQIINTIPALAWSARPDGSAEFFNRHYLDYVGLSAEQAKDWGGRSRSIRMT